MAVPRKHRNKIKVPKINPHAGVAGVVEATTYRRNRENMTTTMPDGVCLGWDTCGHCDRGVLACKCENGVAIPTHVVNMYSRTVQEARGVLPGTTVSLVEMDLAKAMGDISAATKDVEEPSPAPCGECRMRHGHKMDCGSKQPTKTHTRARVRRPIGVRGARREQ